MSDDDSEMLEMSEMHFEEETADSEDNKKVIAKKVLKYYGPVHIVLAIFAIYVAYKCSGNTFAPVPMLASLCCPIFYLIYVVITKGFKFCLDQ